MFNRLICWHLYLKKNCGDATARHGYEAANAHLAHARAAGAGEAPRVNNAEPKEFAP
jgi:hypothetical protein